jgi:uncharacterized membrane protein YdbT with pleckstrin-like domain
VTTSTPETSLWRGTPSHVMHFWTYVLCVLTCWLVVPIGIALWKWLEVRSTTFELTSERLQMASGVFTRRREELELYRVKDTAVEEPFWFRLFGLGNIVLNTSDVRNPVIVIPAVREAESLRNQIRGCVETLRKVKGVREIDAI